jgi:uncharacterized protein YgbK (DUF1537 family)
LRQIDIHHVYAEGGATAARLAEAMGWKQLRAVRELAPGVATMVPEASPATYLTIKPGSYQWPEGLLKSR